MIAETQVMLAMGGQSSVSGVEAGAGDRSFLHLHSAHRHVYIP